MNPWYKVGLFGLWTLVMLIAGGYAMYTYEEAQLAKKLTAQIEADRAENLKQQQNSQITQAQVDKNNSKAQSITDQLRRNDEKHHSVCTYSPADQRLLKQATSY